jgi:hypothetical protein
MVTITHKPSMTPLTKLRSFEDSFSQYTSSYN